MNVTLKMSRSAASLSLFGFKVCTHMWSWKDYHHATMTKHSFDRWKHFVLTLFRVWKQYHHAAMVLKTVGTFWSDHYLQREHVLGCRSDRSSGLGWSAGFHPSHCPQKERLRSPLKNNKCLTVKRENMNYELWMSCCEKYLQRSGTWRAFLKLKPWKDSYLANS